MDRNVTPCYDVSLDYEENYRRGPFGAFAEALAGNSRPECAGSVGDCGVTLEVGAAGSCGASYGSPVVDGGTDAGGDDGAGSLHEFLGLPVREPFGIPAGPLLNARFTTAALRMGFDLVVYKTVRSRPWPCNPFPNVLAVHPCRADGFLVPGSAELEEGVLADADYGYPVSISNSFGVPSRDPDQWQPDLRDALAQAGRGQVVIPSFQGTRTEGMDTRDYIADHVRTARLVAQTGARLMEMNTSCPNEGHNRLLCHDARLVGEITRAVKDEIGDMPLIVKLAYIPDDAALEDMVRRTVGHGSVQGIAAINTISARLVDARGRQALPGAGRERSGVCGHAIREAGLDMVRRLSAIRERVGLPFAIIGVGGVMEPQDYRAYRRAGADAVMSATGAMWDPWLARRIRCERG